CCGLPALNAGDHVNGLKMAQQTIEALEAAPGDVILTHSTSCAVAMLQDYRRLFRDLPQWAERAKSVQDRLTDFAGFMDRVARLPDGALAGRLPFDAVTYHDACQSHNVLGLRAEPRRLLEGVLGLKVVEMRDSAVCCGFGGTFSAEHPEVSARILARKLGNVEATQATVAVTDNPGCIMQLRGGLDAKRSPIMVRHLAEVLAQALVISEKGAVMQETQNTSLGRFALVLVGFSLITLVGFGMMIDDRLGAYGAWGSPTARDTVNVSFRGEEGGTITSTPPGINCGQGQKACSVKFVRPANLTLTVVTAPGFRFDGWYGDCKGGKCQMTVKANANITAAFTRLFKLTVKTNGAGTVQDDSGAVKCSAECTVSFPRDKRIKLYTVTTSGAVFAGWEGDCTGGGECALRFDGDKTLAANFKS
ncbi:MAG: heterodisulfide reductase-related iron-sulfur binding cluster, partial [Chloroflexi bacterium]|nr:heterodisulfide reductase-related iron-sulfur binding cluster [Chloroflexota bacterium]